MKSLVEYISESQINDTVKDLFSQIDKTLKDQKWDEVAPLIESIFKNKWGKAIKLDDNFRDKIDTGNQLLLGYNLRSKAWIIARYNRQAHGIRGAIYSGSYIMELGNTPTYWSNIPRYLEDKKLKLRFAEAYSDEASVIANELDLLDYNFDD